MNVTATGPAAAGYLTVHPCDAVPWVSNANYGAGDVVPALAAVGTGGRRLLRDVAGGDRRGRRPACHPRQFVAP